MRNGEAMALVGAGGDPGVWFRRVARSVARIGVGVALTVGLLVLVAWLLVTRPWVAAGADLLGAQRADPVRLRAEVEALVDGFPQRGADHPRVLAAAAEHLVDRFLAHGVAARQAPYALRGASYANVVARLGPAAGAFVVVGAHYDSFGFAGSNPGADDNASGVAGLLELARLLADRALPVGVELVAYANEEPPDFAGPGMGSAVHAEALRRDGRLPLAMIDLEMIGYYAPRQSWPSPLLALLYPRHGEFVAVVGRHTDRALVERVKAGLLAARAIPVAAYAGPELGGLDASDHRSYWALGVPAVMVTDTAFLRNPHYHAPTDTPATLDYARMAAVVDGVANALLGYRVASGAG